jgi:hypothetical protein
MVRFEREDLLPLAIAEGAEAQSVELRPHVTAERNGGGGSIGSEILDAGEFLTPFRWPILLRGNDNAEGSLAADPSAVGVRVMVDSVPGNRGRCT